MAYGYTRPAQGGSQTGGGTPGGTIEPQQAGAANSHRPGFGHRMATITPAKQYIAPGKNDPQPLPKLLANRDLWQNFVHSYHDYVPDGTFDFLAPEARYQVCTDAHLRDLFLMINNVHPIPVAPQEATPEPAIASGIASMQIGTGSHQSATPHQSAAPQSGNPGINRPPQQTSQHNPTVPATIDACIADLHGKLPLEQFAALLKLEQRVEQARELRDVLKPDLLSILQHLTSYSGQEELVDLCGQIKATIECQLEGECQDHTSEVVDLIKTKLMIKALKKELASDEAPPSTFQVLCKLKLFFNESVLYETLASTRNSHGTCLIEHKEATEIRGYMKNQQAKNTCKFPVNHIAQAYAHVGRPDSKTRKRFNASFRAGITDKAEFIKYLTKLLQGDCELKELIVDLKDNNLAELFAGSEECSQNLMEEFYDPFNSQLPEQQLMEGANNLQKARDQWLRDNTRQFLEEQIDQHWDTILSDTTPTPESRARRALDYLTGTASSIFNPLSNRLSRFFGH